MQNLINQNKGDILTMVKDAAKLPMSRQIGLIFSFQNKKSIKRSFSIILTNWKKTILF